MVKSNYGLYVKELEGLEIIESNRGFATYKIKDEEKELWVYDVFIRPDYRGCGIALRYMQELEELAMSSKCDSLMSITNKNNNNWQRSTDLLIEFGFIVEGISDDGTIFLKKGLNAE